MNAWKVIAATLVIFIAGVVTGGLLVTYAVRVEQVVAVGASVKPSQNPPAKPSNGFNAQAASPWQLRSRDLLRRMDRELGLTQEQHQAIEKILTTSEERTKSLWKPIAPLMNKEMQIVHGEIRDELTPEQQKKFDGFNKQRPGTEHRHQGTNAAPAGLTNTTANGATNEALPAADQ